MHDQLQRAGGRGGVTTIQPCERIEYHDATDAING